MTKDVKDIWRYRDRLLIDDEGVLRMKFNGGRKTADCPFGVSTRNRIVIPKTCVHDEPCGYPCCTAC